MPEPTVLPKYDDDEFRFRIQFLEARLAENYAKLDKIYPEFRSRQEKLQIELEKEIVDAYARTK